MLIVFLVYLIFLLIYSSFVTMALWHIKKYALPDDASRWVIRIFVVGAASMVVVSMILFFLIPWNNLIS